jgi:hypothetical protein
MWGGLLDSLVPISGENVTAVTSSVWPSSAPPLAAPVAASQSLTVLSANADASSDPSGEDNTANTQPVWPLSASPLAAPVAASHSLDWVSMHRSLSACMREVAVAGCLSILSFQQLDISLNAKNGTSDVSTI